MSIPLEGPPTLLQITVADLVLRHWPGVLKNNQEGIRLTLYARCGSTAEGYRQPNYCKAPRRGYR